MHTGYLHLSIHPSHALSLPWSTRLNRSNAFPSPSQPTPPYILLHTFAMSNEDASTVAGAILIVLDIFAVAGRFYSRWSTKVGFGWDDWTILMALVTGILPGALTIWGTFFCFVSPLTSPAQIVGSGSVYAAYLHVL